MMVRHDDIWEYPCEVCIGRGEIPDGLEDDAPWKTCHGCGGTGADPWRIENWLRRRQALRGAVVALATAVPADPTMPGTPYRQN